MAAAAEPIPIPILAGVYVDANPAVRIAYPVNMVPVPGQDGIAEGSLRPAEGIADFTTGSGLDRGALVWNKDNAGEVHYRVSGNDLVTVAADGTVDNSPGAIPGTGLVRMDNSFTLLGIAADGKLFYWDTLNLIEVTDPDAGTVNDMIWVDGYWMVTNGETIAVSDLNVPTSFNTNKYSGTDRPDPIQCLLKVVNEPTVVSRHFIDVLENVGGSGFPFQRILPAVIAKGAVGRRAACVFEGAVAFVGGGKNEAPSVYLGKNAQAVPIASREIDELLREYTTEQLETIHMQAIVDRGSQFLHIHLPDRLLVYDAKASAVARQPVWHIRVTTLAGFAQYRAINVVRFNDKWFVGDPQSAAIGTLESNISTHWGADVRWEFSTGMLRNNGLGAQIHRLDLVALTGVVANGVDPRVFTSFSLDGKTWSASKSVRSGKIGNYNKRLAWLQQGTWDNYRIQRMQGDSSSRLTAVRLEAHIEALRF